MPSLGISATGLDAESRRMEVIADNVANAHSTAGPDGKTYRRKEVVFTSHLENAIGGGNRTLGGVRVSDVIEDPRPLRRDYRPGHPDADSDGFVTMPNVNMVEEMVDMMSASRSYEANLAAVRTAKAMANQALEILK